MNASMLTAFFKMFLMLGLVLGLIYLTVWVMRKASPKMMRVSPNGAIKILAMNYLGPKKALYLVEVVGRVLLIGMTDNNINTLAEFDDPEEIANIQARVERTNAPSPFSNFFASHLKKPEKK
jgi:flagellar protein FliO/FliZ